MEKQFECLRCKEQMKYLKEYRFDSQDNNRGILEALFDIEEHLTFGVYVCPKFRHTEFFFTGAREGFDEWNDW
jgi:predicted nucleic-acid-binding Zn-ribbon protein